MQGMVQRALVLVAIAMSAAVALGTAAAPAQAASARRITICHATSSASNPYVTITVDRNGLNGHGSHPGDIIPAPARGCPRSTDSCDGHGLPCHSIPEFRSERWGLAAGLLGVAAAVAMGRRRRRDESDAPPTAEGDG